jgi:hypothetical protein
VGKRKVVVYIIVIVLIIAGVLLSFKAFTYFYIAQANKHLNMGEIKLLEKEENIKAMLIVKFTPNPGFGLRGYISEKEGIEIRFSGFPDVIDKYVLTDIETTNPRHSFYDIHIGEDVDKAVEVLRKNGFRTSEKTGQYTYKKDRLLVSIDVGSDNKIEKISIQLESTNRLRVVFKPS